MENRETISVLFVCMGNICRSPTAEAVFRHAVASAGLSGAIECDSAGTHGYHIGEPPDQRAQQAALRRGYDMSNLRGRKVAKLDFERFDHVVAMDRHNLALLEAQCPKQHAHKLALFCDFKAEFTGR
ncbi:MAG: low molecular weight phosphotyrosine protein phosphatase, partial [Gallionella sp.]|nr:low molecular weight phosphotyrosine protein phosphatase [Gallionella sp.]